jgi:hypothetical protein
MRSEKLIRKRLKFFAEMERKVQKSKKMKRKYGRFFRDAIILLWWVLDDEKIALGDFLDSNEKTKSKAMKIILKS